MTTITETDHGFDLTGVPNNFRGGVATGGLIFAAILKEIGFDLDEAAPLIETYCDAAEGVLDQVGM